MNIKTHIFIIALIVTALSACKKDDDVDVVVVPPRDRGEQQIKDDALLQDYLKTHFYTLEDVYVNGDNTVEYRTVKLDTIAGDNSDKPSIMDSGLVTTKKITKGDVEYTLYVLGLRTGEGSQKPTFADSTLVTYKGQLPYKNGDKIFDSALNPVWFDLTSVVDGFREALVDFKGASGVSKYNEDGTVTYNDDFGELVVFIPSGLAYFSEARTSIPAYSSLIFNVQLYKVNEADHDRDGIPSYLEDLDGDGMLVMDVDDNTDGDGFVNYLDTDDDGDGILTKNEITVKDLNQDGFITLDEITFYDDNGNGIKNHLDKDDRDSKNK
ncbi:FKBP-type peptidyl-prolyl cis-trans isomerase [Aquimarina muelleri]|uniref:peptidylprolyl isomerase n=1 Tax=Aquimarina muelleri TaxID=279356 RepID=A0A918N297_9FLAO|nr:hypothetical protein [Aquimarina muelleri]MCX2763885.1 hypothetical protein [Aquimarina muelleri]GGX10889.1 hypothetical protein GCM10007384_10780 [Aquimarina muelleri]